MHSSRSYSKNKVPYQITLEERYTTFRAKIEHQNIRKRYIKYTYTESTLDGLFKTFIFLTHFKASRCQNGGVTRWCQPLLALKSRASLLANFSQTAERKTTPLVQFEALLEIRIILKNEPNSSRSYIKNKVPYQLTPEEGYAIFRAKIDLLNYIKWGVKYVWRQSALSNESIELTIESK